MTKVIWSDILFKNRSCVKVIYKVLKKTNKPNPFLFDLKGILDQFFLGYDIDHCHTFISTNMVIVIIL